MPEQSVGPPRGEECPTCRMTRWEGKQVEGWLEASASDLARVREALLRQADETLRLAAQVAALKAGGDAMAEAADVLIRNTYESVMTPEVRDDLDNAVAAWRKARRRRRHGR